jgi:predicted amidohydrolase
VQKLSIPQSDDFDSEASWELNLRHASLTYGMPMVMANHCGTRGDLRFWGGSRILNARDDEMACAGSDPILITARVDFSDVRLARARLPTIRDSDPHLVYTKLRRALASGVKVPQLGGD